MKPWVEVLRDSESEDAKYSIQKKNLVNERDLIEGGLMFQTAAAELHVKTCHSDSVWWDKTLDFLSLEFGTLLKPSKHSLAIMLEIPVTIMQLIQLNKNLLRHQSPVSI